MSSSSLKSTLRLPVTSFPGRSNSIDVARRLQPLMCDDIYTWQASQSDRPQFTLHDGPPYANGSLHMGHFVNKVLKDFVNRYKVLQGYRVSYVPGWDCHGLPIELKAVGNKKLSPVIVRKKAQAWAEKFVKSQKDDFRKWGLMADWDNCYLTMQKEYEAQEMRVFGRMAEKGLIYRAKKPVYWSPSSMTALAEAELEYKDDHCSRSVYCVYESELGGLLAWTTTPWTLPGSAAVAVSEDMSYSIVDMDGTRLIVGTDLLEKVMGDMQYSVVKQVLGSDLVGLVAKHPFMERQVPVIVSEFVTSDSGTGIVHTAPAHGKEDHIVCLRNSISLISTVEGDGRFNDVAGSDLAGLDIFTDGTAKVLELLTTKATLFKEEPYLHRYPYDWRTKEPVIQRATTQWFVNLDSLKDKSLEAIKNVKFTPTWGASKLGNTINSRSEWCISRQRHWGVPIPVFYHKETKEALMTKESIEHVANAVEQHGSDCWWTLPIKDLLPESEAHRHEEFEKGFDTMDVWFDSGSSWKSALTPRGIEVPYDLIIEGSDQHRGWFQSSMLTRMALEDTPPFKSLVTHGFVMDETKNKMSKSLGNIIAPSDVIEGRNGFPRYGVDALRFWVASTDFRKDMSISELIIKKSTQTFVKFRTVLRFLLGSLDGFDPSAAPLPRPAEMNIVDRYMMARVGQFARAAEAGYEEYDFVKVMKQLEVFTFKEASAFYFTCSKDVLYTALPDGLPRRTSQYVLLQILDVISKTLAPIVPHLVEETFEHLPPGVQKYLLQEGAPSSVFASGWVKSQDTKAFVDEQVIADFQQVFALKSALNSLIEDLKSKQLVKDARELAVVVDGDISVLKELSECNRLCDVLGVSQVSFGSVSECLSCTKLDGVNFGVSVAQGVKCSRCWQTKLDFENYEDTHVCSSCASVISSIHQ